MPDNKTGAFEKYVTRTSSILMYVSMGMLLVMMFLTAVDVFGRYFFNRPIVGTGEILRTLLPGIVLLGLAYTQFAKGHVRIEILYSRLPPKLRVKLGLAITFWAIILFVVIMWQGIMLAISFWQQGRVFVNIGVPVFLVELFVPIGALAICLALIVDVVHFFVEIRRGG